MNILEDTSPISIRQLGIQHYQRHEQTHLKPKGVSREMFQLYRQRLQTRGDSNKNNTWAINYQYYKFKQFYNCSKVCQRFRHPSNISNKTDDKDDHIFQSLWRAIHTVYCCKCPKLVGYKQRRSNRLKTGIAKQVRPTQYYSRYGISQEWRLS